MRAEPLDKVASVIPLLVDSGFCTPLPGEDVNARYVTVRFPSGKVVPLGVGSPATAIWLLDHLTRGVQVKANTDSFGFIGPARWEVRVSSTVTWWGRGVGRSLPEAVFRAFYHALTAKREEPAWLKAARDDAYNSLEDLQL